jgi:MFS family permease
MPTAHAFQQRRWLALAAVVLAQFMVVLDVSIVNVALPPIRNDLHFSLENLQAATADTEFQARISAATADPQVPISANPALYQVAVEFLRPGAG